ncbi:MAG: hypothetical protein ACK6CP_07470 [Pseudanabaena sp.]|jgi:exodeoxyribonuclease V alpha subunit
MSLVSPSSITYDSKYRISLGESKEIGLAVKQVSDRHRYTYLAERLAKFADPQS